MVSVYESFGNRRDRLHSARSELGSDRDGIKLIKIKNILASTPSVRRILMNVGSISRSRGPLGVILLNGIITLATVASIASLIPAAIVLAKHMPAQNDDLQDIYAVISVAERANDSSLLAALAEPVANLMLRGQKIQEAVQIAGYYTAGWLIAIW